MIVTYSHEQMLSLWRHLLAVEPLRLDCEVGRTDSVDLDAMIAPVMRAWYLHVLDSADLKLLPVENVAAEALCEPRLRGVTVVVPPQRARRIVSVAFAGWPMPVRADASEADVMRCGANACWPVPMAATLADGSIAAAAVAGGALTQLWAVVDAGPHAYVFDESLINTITDYARRVLQM